MDISGSKDLWGANLQGADIGVDLEKVNLREANLKWVNLREANLEQANLKP